VVPRVQEAFEGVKTLICNAPVLAGQWDIAFKLEVNVSHVSAGAVRCISVCMLALCLWWSLLIIIL